MRIHLTLPFIGLLEQRGRIYGAGKGCSVAITTLAPAAAQAGWSALIGAFV
jgi:hypothetical protein